MRQATLNIIYEDDDLLVVDKPPRLLCSTNARERRPTLLAQVGEYLTQQPRARVGLIHRLDRDASGLLVFSKNPRAFADLKRQFFNHSAERIYLALVEGTPTPTSGTIRTHLVEWADGSVHITKNHKADVAITHYQSLASHNARTLLRVKLETGRKHQIRAHLAHKGWPIVNDSVYGKVSDQQPMMLRAVELSVDHPRDGKRMTFQAKIPRPLQALAK